MPALTYSTCSDYSIVSSLDALSFTSSARPSWAPPHSRNSVASSKSSRRTGQRKQLLIDTNRQLMMPTPAALSGSVAGASTTDTQAGVAALTKASLATLTDIRHEPKSSMVLEAKMPTTRSQSRAASEVSTTISSTVHVHVKQENVKRESSPSLLHPIPNSEPDSQPTSPLVTPTEADVISTQLSQLMIKVELVDSDEEAEMMDEVPELSDFGAMRLSEIPRIKTPGPTSVMSTEDAHSTIESFLNSRSRFISDKDNKLRLWQSLCIELGLVTIKEEDDLTPSLPSTQTRGSLPSVPTSLTAARALLKKKDHVKIHQYLEARKVPVAAGQRRDVSNLLHGDTRALAKYTKKTKNYTPREFAKDEWLQPLMRSISPAGPSRR